ncbi:FAD-dependent oxidoreductase [Mesorhizobium atlanticum]
MANGHFIEGIAGGRLSSEQYTDNFSDLHRRSSHHEALVESDRCYFCYDAPCMNACPTSIDIPLFIRQIATGNPLGSAKTIFDQNILGGMCARVCPTETAVRRGLQVREVAEGKPVQIGRLQRYATDVAMSEGKQFYKRAEPTGKTVAVVGAGPAGLAAAHRLARHGHDVTILERGRRPAASMNMASLPIRASMISPRLKWTTLTSIGGIDIQNGKALGRDFQLGDLMRNL